MEETISLQEIAKIIKKRLWLIIFFTVVGIGISTGISFFVLTPIYQAQTQILVNQNISPEELYSMRTTETDLRLINTYNVIITSPVILTPALEQLDLDMTPEQLMKQIFVSSKNDSKVVNIRVEDPNPAYAVDISNAVAEVFKEKIPQLMRVDNISILSAAEYSDNPSPVKPKKLMNIAIGGLIGLMIGVGFVFLLEYLDMTIKSEREVEEYLELPVIGIVGFFDEETKKRYSRKARRS
ncbi:YveK family protein [Solibacillus sp. FSL K6-4121]|uniref:YveK family protein n=1 Tax=Solibacillus sp. FSL K6-4121 TaxID=2921505 RepID=UPI0030FC8376